MTNLLIQYNLICLLYFYIENSGYLNLRFWGSKGQNTAWQTIFLNLGHPNLVNNSFKTVLPRKTYRTAILWNFDRTKVTSAV